jgi:hypothetical protein
MSTGDQRAHIDFGAAIRGPDFHRAPGAAEPIDELVRDPADRDGNAARHAPFASAAERRELQGLDGLLQVGVGHDNQVILGAPRRLNALPVRRASLVDVPRDIGRADKRDRPHQRMSQ